MGENIGEYFRNCDVTMAVSCRRYSTLRFPLHEPSTSTRHRSKLAPSHTPRCCYYHCFTCMYATKTSTLVTTAFIPLSDTLILSYYKYDKNILLTFPLAQGVPTTFGTPRHMSYINVSVLGLIGTLQRNSLEKED